MYSSKIEFKQVKSGEKKEPIININYYLYEKFEFISDYTNIT